jgi:hypothetical protein
LSVAVKKGASLAGQWGPVRRFTMAVWWRHCFDCRLMTGLT